MMMMMLMNDADDDDDDEDKQSSKFNFKSTHNTLFAMRLAETFTCLERQRQTDKQTDRQTYGYLDKKICKSNLFFLYIYIEFGVP